MIPLKLFNKLSLFIILSTLMGCSSIPEGFLLEEGMQLAGSLKILGISYNFEGKEGLNQPILTITGKDVVIDFQNATFVGNQNPTQPDLFKGLAILVRNGENITLKNLNIQGYKVAILADNVRGLIIENANLSYNYRQHLKSTTDREDLSDWLSYHNNEEDEWLRYGAGLYLKDCDQATITQVTVTGGQNGIMITNSNGGIFYNNTIQFNSGVGIGLYRSSKNRIMHNKLDWNVRGYSHNIYSRGQDSAGILCYEQSNDNIFAYNSATHSGDGFFLWAGQSTMETGRGGCNNNLIYRNDFSFAPTNGVELTFSKNKVIENIIEGCKYGIWAGYSYNSDFLENEIIKNAFGIAIEHGNKNNIERNAFEENETGLWLWERDEQPADWGFAQNRLVKSTSYNIKGNFFKDNQVPLKIFKTSKVKISNNHFLDFGKLLDTDERENIDFSDNISYQEAGILLTELFFNKNQKAELQSLPAKSLFFKRNIAIDPLPDGQLADLPKSHPKGRAFILVNEWGPYDFNYPLIWLREKKENDYIFVLLGPKGSWRLKDQNGFESVLPKSGGFPSTITATRKADADFLTLNLEFVGAEVTDQFGRKYPKGKPVPFAYKKADKVLDWNVQFFEYAANMDPVEDYERLTQIKATAPKYLENTTNLSYNWWQSPGGMVNPDQFITIARTSFDAEPGSYTLSLTGDDGVKLYLDGQLLIDEWDVHTPQNYQREIQLGGSHELEIEHFESGGLAVLDFKLIRIR